MLPPSLWLRARPLVSALILLLAVFVGLHLSSGVDTARAPQGLPDSTAPLITALPPPAPTRRPSPTPAPPTPSPPPVTTPTATWVVLQSLPLVPVEPSATPAPPKN